MHCCEKERIKVLFGKIFTHATTQQNVSDHDERRTQVVTQHWITNN